MFVRRFRDESGAILMLALAILVALLLLAVSSSFLTRSDQLMTRRRGESEHSFFLADAGLRWARSRLRGGDASLYFDDTATLDGVTLSFPDGTATVDVGARDAAGFRAVTSRGNVEGSTRTVEGVVQHFSLDPGGPEDCFTRTDTNADGLCDGRFGIVGERSLRLAGESLVDSYAADHAPYDSTTAQSHGHLVTNDSVRFEGSATVHGALFEGRLGADGRPSPSEGIRPLPTLHLPPLPSFDSVCSGHTNPSLVDCSSPFGTLTTILAGSPPSETLTIGSGQTVCMPPGEYCFRRIEVKTGGTLRLVDYPPALGTLTEEVVWHLAGSSSDPALDVSGRLEYGTGVRPNLLRVRARGDMEIVGWSGAEVFGVFYAPRSVIRMNTNDTGHVMNLFGAMAARKVDLGWRRVRLHVDETARFGPFCSDGADPDCEPAFVIRRAWRENGA